MRKGWKLASLAVMGGVLLQFGGICNALWVALPAYLGTELLLDFNGIFDVFEDGGLGEGGQLF